MTTSETVASGIDRDDPKAVEALLTLVYKELRQLAASRLANQPPGQTLQATALVHEVWLRLVGAKYTAFENRAQFFSVAAETMRCILVDRARRRLTRRHGGGYERVPIEECDIASPESDGRFFGVHEVLEKLKKLYPTHAEVVKLRYLVGMTNNEVAETLGVSVATVKNYWVFARDWIFQELRSS